MSSMSSCRFDYARDLTGSAQDRIFLEGTFKFSDHVARNLQNLIYSIELVKDRCLERLERTYGTVTSARLRTYLTDGRRTEKPLSRKDADRVTAELATKAYREKRQFTEVVLEDEQVTSMLEEGLIGAITDPKNYIGQSREVMEAVYKQIHGKKKFKKD